MLQISRVAAALAAASMMFAAPAMANETTAPSFDNVGISYVELDIADQSTSGFAIDFEKSFSPKVFLSIEHLDASETYVESLATADAAFEVSAMLTHANLGYKFYDTGATVAYMAAGFSRTEAGASVALSDNSFSDSFSDSDSGWNAQVGVRSLLTSNIEIDAAVRHIDIANDSDQELSVAGRYYLQPNLSLSAGYTHVNSEMSYARFGVSYHF